jgi:hypothetical protein
VKIWSKRAAGIGAIIGGLLVAGTVAAGASDLASVPGVGSALSAGHGAKSQLAHTASTTPAKARKQPASQARSTSVRSKDSSGVLTGIDTTVKVTRNNVPVTVCGIAVGVASDTTRGDCAKRTASGKDDRDGKGGSGGDSTTVSTKDSSGVLTGIDTTVDVSRNNVPVLVCGAAVGVLADQTTGKCPK